MEAQERTRFGYATAKIAEVRQENYRVKTFVLDCGVEARPGQFAMVWIPGMDEKPMCIVNDDPLTFSVAKVGPFSSKLHGLGAGDKISFRAPLGNSFAIPTGAKKIILVGGGYGVAALHFLARVAKGKGVEPVMVVGARKRDDVIFEGDFAKLGVKTVVATDDGSGGVKGTAIDAVRQLLDAGEKFDCAYACGPEMMMHALAAVAQKEDMACQLSLERFMGCGIGICGKCDAGGGLVCQGGPVYNSRAAFKLEEFGICHRDTMGNKIRW
ncbi:dihydroorotate dehydrogenase electron transfer subunit [Candidatus Micrarchaeota archaeon]|nr:dihydroorotate dehydrogenase electron transfer subunit [Candidatus Micrarchaeota archaeon]MBI5176800.1 dihydroorotate dehydrogenase electron transfer subunit [Candidatus Micrarchaeota archaeon]